LALKIESFRTFATIFKILTKLSFQNVDTNENIEKHSICNFLSNFLGGREIAQEGAKNIDESFAETLGKNFGNIM